MMQKGTPLLRCSRARTRAGFTLLALLLSVLAGCAVGEKVKPQTAEQKAAAAAQSTVPQGPTVARLKDGREGFVITETPHMEAEWRSDFEHAIAMMEDKDYENAAGLLEKVIAAVPRRHGALYRYRPGLRAHGPAGKGRAEPENSAEPSSRPPGGEQRVRPAASQDRPF